MSFAISQAVTLITDGSGNAAGVTDPIGGKIHAIVYTKVDFANGVDFTITDTVTGATLWTQVDQNASAVKYPRFIAQAGAGTDLTGWYVEPVALGTVTIAIAQGGAAKTGTFRVIYER